LRDDVATLDAHNARRIEPVATIVLIPAAWCGGWCWRAVAPGLRAAGHEVLTATPTGLGDRAHLAHPEIGLETHITDLANLLQYDDLREVTLVGWSYGGMVMTGVAHRSPERIAHLIYLDSAVPADGQSIFDASEDDGTARASYEARIAAAGTPGFLPFSTDGFEAAMSDAADRAWFLERVVPHPFKTFTDSVRADNPEAARPRRSFVLCTEGVPPNEPDPAFLVGLRSDPAWTYREIAANHFAPISAPGLTVDALLALL
jgi:pimeloyl-ACP methyl ester carboxylesterase